jgi:phosphoglycolate phosphatase-like HAD superfamily hydrolase
VSTLLLFDIDHTLLWTGGAGRRALESAFLEVLGVRNGLDGVPVSGRTDPAILRDMLRQHGLSDGRKTLERLLESYLRHLERFLPLVRGRVMPGIPELLTALRGREGVRMGLATGNVRRGAQLKLAHYRLDGYFSDGAFGDEAEDRPSLVALAIRRLGGEERPRRVLVIGDTPLDVQAAKACDAIAVAVATGEYSQEELLRAGADLVFPDLSDWRGALVRLLGEAP